MKFRSMHLALILALAAISGAIGCGGGGSSTTKSPTPGVSGVHSAYVANYGSSNISEYAIDSSGILHEITGSSPFKVASHPTKLVMTPDGNFLYAFDGVNTIYSMSINSSTGVLTLINTQNSGAAPADAAIDPKGKFLYVGNSGAYSISVYAIGSDGKLTETAFSPVAVNGPVRGLTVSAKGTYVFAAVPNTGSIYQFAADATTGALTAKAGSPMTVGTGPVYVAPSPDETFAIVLDADSSIRRFNMDSTGAMTLAPFSPFIGGTQPIQAFVDSTNTYVYILNRTGDSLTTLGFQSTGAPFQVSKASTGINPSSMAMSGNFIYATNQDAGTVTEYSLAAGVATLLSTGSVPASTSPLSIAVR